MSVDWANEGRKMGIADARALLAERTNIEVFWRPEPNLPEPEQYALVYEG